MANRNRLSDPLSRETIKGMFTGIEYLDDESKAEPAAVANALSSTEQEFVQHWARIMRKSDHEVARLFVENAPEALSLMDLDGLENWALHILDAFDQRGLGHAARELESLSEFAGQFATRNQTLKLDEVRGVLEKLVSGLGGRKLRIESGDSVFTDSETIYMPAVLQGAAPELLFQHYKAMAVHHWAQCWYGSFRPEVLKLLNANPSRLKAFSALERCRVDACIERNLPGAWRTMQQLNSELDSNLDESSLAALSEVAKPTASALDCFEMSANLNQHSIPPTKNYHGEFRPEQVSEIQSARIQSDREQFRASLARLIQEQAPESLSESGLEHRRIPAVSVSTAEQSDDPNTQRVISVLLEGLPLSPSPEFESLASSIMQDLGKIPEEDLRPSGSKSYDPTRTADVAPDMDYTSGADCFHYREWDYTRQRFRENYCTLREYPGELGEHELATEILERYHGLVASIRRSFEVLQGASRLERRQPDGEDIDLDAVVEGYSNALRGDEMGEGLYLRLRENRRSIAVMFMVDMSGSTKGWVNQAERESLLLLCQALETTGDRYAIYGFSGRTQKRVEAYKIKAFADRYGREVRQRIAGINSRSYTRMGAAIRHFGALLKQEPARHKLLITLSDGKPEDYGNYYGRYGIEDTRHALLELRRDGIQPFCITIDKQARDYLPYMYGDSRYALVDEVSKLPLEVAGIYRKLTS